MVSNHLATSQEGKVFITQLVAYWLLGTVIKGEVWTLACGYGHHQIGWNMPTCRQTNSLPSSIETVEKCDELETENVHLESESPSCSINLENIPLYSEKSQCLACKLQPTAGTSKIIRNQSLRQISPDESQQPLGSTHFSLATRGWQRVAFVTVV